MRHFGGLRSSELLEPFREPAYQRLIGGSSLNGIASWVFYTALAWTTLQTTGVAAAVGLLSVVLVIPVPVALLVSGVITDRRGPARILLLAQALNAGTYGAALALAALGRLGFETTLALGVLQGVAQGLSGVPYQALLVRLVDPRLVRNAYGLSLLQTAVARLAGGPLGGLLVEIGGPVPALGVSTVCATITLLVFIGLPALPGLEAARSRLAARDLGDAMRWVRQKPVSLAVIATGALMAAFFWPYSAALPLVSRDLLGGGAADLGLLIAAGGLGVLVTAVIVLPIGRRLGQGRLLIAAILASAAGLAGLGASTSVVSAMVLSAVLGGASNAQTITEGLLLQTMAPPRIRGRVLALDATIFNLVNPAGLFVVGFAIDRFGVGAVLVAMGALTAAAAILVASWRREVLDLDVDSAGELAERASGGSPGSQAA